MSGPIDVVLGFHNAFRRDMLEIDDAAYKAARSGEDITHILNRLHITAEILDHHARGEEEAVFPAVDKLAPLVSKAYLLDHRELDTMHFVVTCSRSMTLPSKQRAVVRILLAF